MTERRLESFVNRVKRRQEQAQASKVPGSFLAILLTTTCPVGCEHCIFSCTKQGEEISLEFLSKLIREWRDIIDSVGVSFTGGEPFYNINLLRHGIKYAHALNLTVKVVTSGYWAISRRAAFDTLSGLGGISELAISIDSFHQKRCLRFAPLQHSQWLEN